MNIVKYLIYLYETIQFNYYYKYFYGSDIGLFENCDKESYQNYKNL